MTLNKTKTRYGTPINVLGWQNQEAGMVKIESLKGNFLTFIQIEDIEITEKIEQFLNLST